jgi:hypothetical protein
MLRALPVHSSHLWNALLILAGGGLWAAICWAVLRMTKATLLDQMKRRARA